MGGLTVPWSEVEAIDNLNDRHVVLQVNGRFLADYEKFRPRWLRLLTAGEGYMDDGVGLPGLLAVQPQTLTRFLLDQGLARAAEHR